MIRGEATEGRGEEEGVREGNRISMIMTNPNLSTTSGVVYDEILYTLACTYTCAHTHVRTCAHTRTCKHIHLLAVA